VVAQIEHNGEQLLVADALLPVSAGRPPVGQFAIRTSDLKAYVERGQGTAIAQLYEIVLPGLILSTHIFRGLNRPLYCDGSVDGDKKKLIYTRRPRFDVDLRRGHSPGDYTIVRREPPPGRTYIVIVSPNERHREAYPVVDAWIEHWNWVEEDRGLLGAPVDWIGRYEVRLHSNPTALVGIDGAAT
jgi:hypothetical protein